MRMTSEEKIVTAGYMLEGALGRLREAQRLLEGVAPSACHYLLITIDSAEVAFEALLREQRELDQRREDLS
jgi:hypothetical protein